MHYPKYTTGRTEKATAFSVIDRAPCYLLQWSKYTTEQDGYGYEILAF